MIQSKSSQAEKTEIKRVFFLKTHKCASSTVQNILMRFGHNENLDFLLPDVKNYVGNPKHFSTSMVADKYSTVDGKFDMFVHHTRYSEEVKSVMRPDTIYITILREPTSLFESIYSFFHFEKKYKKSLTEFINGKLINNVSFPHYVSRYSERLGINQMSWDLGLASKDFENIEVINKHIQMVERDFDFVIIFEYLEASLVLFANLMGWPLERVAYLPLNTRNNSYKQILSEQDFNKLKDINMADCMLYNKFLQKFKEKVHDYGVEKLERDIGKLMAINREIMDKCVESKTNKGYARTISYKLKENNYAICKYIAINELVYTSILRETQYERHEKYRALDKLINNY